MLGSNGCDTRRIAAPFPRSSDAVEGQRIAVQVIKREFARPPRSIATVLQSSMFRSLPHPTNLWRRRYSDVWHWSIPHCTMTERKLTAQMKTI